MQLQKHLKNKMQLSQLWNILALQSIIITLLSRKISIASQSSKSGLLGGLFRNELRLPQPSALSSVDNGTRLFFCLPPPPWGHAKVWGRGEFYHSKFYALPIIESSIPRIFFSLLSACITRTEWRLLWRGKLVSLRSVLDGAWSASSKCWGKIYSSL